MRQEIASGGSAKVFLADAMKPSLAICGPLVVVKEFTNQHHNLAYFNQEVALMAMFKDHPRFVKQKQANHIIILP